MASAMKLMTITPKAAERLQEILSNSDQGATGLRVGVKNAGCAGMAYTMDYVTEPMAGDDHVHEHGLDVYIDPKAMLFLLGSEMDFAEGKMSAGFTFTNPNELSACGCGESVQLEAADLAELAAARQAQATRH